MPHVRIKNALRSKCARRERLRGNGSFRCDSSGTISVLSRWETQWTKSPKPSLCVGYKQFPRQSLTEHPLWDGIRPRGLASTLTLTSQSDVANFGGETEVSKWVVALGNLQKPVIASHWLLCLWTYLIREFSRGEIQGVNWWWFPLAVPLAPFAILSFFTSSCLSVSEKLNRYEVGEVNSTCEL